jgi:hypothetical protein
MSTATPEHATLPVGFRVVPRGQGAPLKSPGSQLPPLGKTWREETSHGTWEAVQAVTADGEWLFEREGRTWSVGHLPTRTVVKTGLRSVRACRVYVGSGQARADLEKATGTGAGAR